METLTSKYADRAVRSVFVYTREAHPGELMRHHSTMEDKRHHAGALRDQFGVTRQILLDDIEGTAHKAWGMLPNMAYIVMRGGLIVYRAAWTDAADVEDALEQALDAGARRAKDRLTPFYSERLGFRPNDMDKFRAGLERNGPQAVSDFFPKKN